MATADVLVSEIEDIVDDGVAVLWEVLAELTEMLGGRSYGFAKVPRDLLLDWWVEIRDNVDAVGQLIAEDAQFIVSIAQALGLQMPQSWPSIVLRRVTKDVIEMEAMLERAGGPEAVQARAVMRRLGEAQKALTRLEKQEALPPFTVAPPARILSQSELLGMGADGSASLTTGAAPVEGMGVGETYLPFSREGAA